MREFKFRLWDKEFKKMKDWWDINNSHNLQAIMYEEAMNYRKHDLMQYTGLKDIKGTEIYEGDFLIYESFGGKREILEVWYEDDWAAFSFGNKKLSYIKNTMEIIGNIYENPELLEV